MAFSIKIPSILLVSTFFFFQKISIFLAKIVPLLKAILWELCWRFFSSVFSFSKIIGCYWLKCRKYRPCVWNPGSRLIQINYQTEKWLWSHELPTGRLRKIFFDVAVFLLSSLVTGPSFMSISLPVLELWQFLFTKEFGQKSRNWKLPRLSFFQYLETWVDQGYNIWQEYL